MKLKDLEATKIVKYILGDREQLKSEDELAVILKKRLTKKEREILNATVLNKNQEEVLKQLHIDLKRYEEILECATKKIKNQSLHKEFY